MYVCVFVRVNDFYLWRGRDERVLMEGHQSRGENKIKNTQPNDRPLTSISVFSVKLAKFSQYKTSKWICSAVCMEIKCEVTFNV